jgi:hypothetical protein
MSIFRALTGPARLLLLIAVAWVVVWGSVWGYSSYRTQSLERVITAESQMFMKLADDPSKAAETQNSLSSLRYSNTMQMKTLLWTDRATWAGPIGLVAILSFGIGGWWVYQGFRKPVGSATH